MQQSPDERENSPTPQDGGSSESSDGSKKRSADQGPSMMVLGGAAMEFGASIVVMALLGWWADSWFGTEPWLLLTGLTVGLVGGVYNLYRLGKRFF